MNNVSVESRHFRDNQKRKCTWRISSIFWGLYSNCNMHVAQTTKVSSLSFAAYFQRFGIIPYNILKCKWSTVWSPNHTYKAYWWFEIWRHQHSYFYSLVLLFLFLKNVINHNNIKLPPHILYQKFLRLDSKRVSPLWFLY